MKWGHLYPDWSGDDVASVPLEDDGVGDLDEDTDAGPLRDLLDELDEAAGER
jgi:hypothetical protein